MNNIRVDWYEYFIIKSRYKAGMEKIAKSKKRSIVAQNDPSDSIEDQNQNDIPDQPSPEIVQKPLIYINPNGYYTLHPEKRAEEFAYSEPCPKCNQKSDTCQCNPCYYCQNSEIACQNEYTCDRCDECGEKEKECSCEVCDVCNQKRQDCKCDRCPACEEVVNEKCECDRCGECGMLDEDCECERCPHCNEVTDYCECEQCNECGEKIPDCACRRCDSCEGTMGECISNGSCGRCGTCEELDERCDCIAEAEEKLEEIEQEWEGEKKPFAHWFPEDEERYVEKYNPDMSDIDHQIVYLIENINKDKFGYKVPDYDKGYAIDKYGREIKIGRALSNVLKSADDSQIIEMINKISYKNISREIEDIKKYYMDSLSKAPARHASFRSNQEYSILFSQNSRDIIEMSHNKSWDSCMNIRGGENRRYVFCEAREGSLIAYLVENGDHDEILNNKSVEDAVARIHIKRYVNQDGISIAVPERRMYTEWGNAIPGFYEAVCSWIKEHQGVVIPGVYERDPKLYSDTLANKYVVIPEDQKPLQDKLKMALGSQGKYADVESLLDGANSKFIQSGLYNDETLNLIKLCFYKFSNNILGYKASQFFGSFPSVLKKEDIPILAENKWLGNVIREMRDRKIDIPTDIVKSFGQPMYDTIKAHVKDGGMSSDVISLNYDWIKILTSFGEDEWTDKLISIIKDRTDEILNSDLLGDFDKPGNINYRRELYNIINRADTGPERSAVVDVIIGNDSVFSELMGNIKEMIYSDISFASYPQEKRADRISDILDTLIRSATGYSEESANRFLPTLEYMAEEFKKIDADMPTDLEERRMTRVRDRMKQNAHELSMLIEKIKDKKPMPYMPYGRMIRF